jgi:hypothetical protein
MLPNARNNTRQVKRLIYSKLNDDKYDDNAASAETVRAAEAKNKKLHNLREMFTHTNTFVTSRIDTRASTINAANVDKTTPDNLPRRQRNMRASAGHKGYIYPFITETITDPKKLSALSALSASEVRVHVCIFRIYNDIGQVAPFTQFKLQRSKNDHELHFPEFKFISSSSSSSSSARASDCREQADKIVGSLFPDNVDNIEFMGAYECGDDDRADDNKHGAACYFIYEDVSTPATYDTASHTAMQCQKNTDVWWWACSYEIFNRVRVLNHPIHYSVIQLFDSAPTIMFLYDDKTGHVIEIPHVLYSGITEGGSVDETVSLGPRKLTDNSFMDAVAGSDTMTDKRSHLMFGSQFYFYELDDVFRNACYAYHDKKDKYVKMREAFIFRYVVFLGVTYVTLFDTDNTTTHPPFDSCSKYKNVEWCAEGFNSAYHGNYGGGRGDACPPSDPHRAMGVRGGGRMSPSNPSSKEGCGEPLVPRALVAPRGGGVGTAGHDKKWTRSLDPIFCVCDNERIVLLSYYAIDMDTVPETPPILSTSTTTDAQYVIL